MISTVTTSTVTSISTITSTIGFGLALGLVAVITLAAFLCARELAAAGGGRLRSVLVRALNISIVPLVIAFLMIVAMKVVEILAT